MSTLSRRLALRIHASCALKPQRPRTVTEPYGRRHLKSKSHAPRESRSSACIVVTDLASAPPEMAIGFPQQPQHNSPNLPLLAPVYSPTTDVHYRKHITFCCRISPRIANRSDDFPAPTWPTTTSSSPAKTCTLMAPQLQHTHSTTSQYTSAMKLEPICQPKAACTALDQAALLERCMWMFVYTDCHLLHQRAAPM